MHYSACSNNNKKKPPGTGNAHASTAQLTRTTRHRAHPGAHNIAADILGANVAPGRAGKAACIDANGSWTYGQLADRAARFGAMLRAKGMRREERILICLLDTIDWPTAFLGALKAGAVAIP